MTLDFVFVGTSSVLVEFCVDRNSVTSKIIQIGCYRFLYLRSPVSVLSPKAYRRRLIAHKYPFERSVVLPGVISFKVLFDLNK